MYHQFSESKNLTWQEIKNGDCAEFRVKITQEEVEQFIKLCGDKNPLHRDESFAREKGFERPIVHGMLISSFFSTLVGVELPGQHCLYLSQSIQFKKPIFIGEEIRVTGKVKKKIESVKILYIETNVFNQNNELAVSGEAVVKYVV